MSTTPRLKSAIAGETPSLGNVLAHAPDMMARFGDLYAALWQTGTLPVDLREMTRLRNARVTDCGF